VCALAVSDVTRKCHIHDNVKVDVGSGVGGTRRRLAGGVVPRASVSKRDVVT